MNKYMGKELLAAHYACFPILCKGVCAGENTFIKKRKKSTNAFQRAFQRTNFSLFKMHVYASLHSPGIKKQQNWFQVYNHNENLLIHECTYKWHT